MPSISVPQVLVLSAFLYLAASLPIRDEDEAESFLTQIKYLNAPWSTPGMNARDEDALLEARFRPQYSTGVDRRRQLGDIEFSNRYAEFLRSKAKHNSICTFLRRMQSVKKSGAGDTERVNLLLRQYMCPSSYNWPTDL